MNRITIGFTVAALAGCGTMHSGRVLPQGKTQVGVGATRMSISRSEEVLYGGTLRVSHGTSENFEFGAELTRNPGLGETTSVFSLVPKFQLSRSATSAVALAVPVSIAWGEQGIADVGGGTGVVFPTLYAGFDLSSNAELVFGPRFGAAKFLGGKGSAFGFGGTMGVRFGDPTTGSTLQPEVGFLRMYADGGEGEGTFLMIGLGVTAGD